MSLFALPVSVNDLTQLQLGIEFFTDTAEATTEQGLITNPPFTHTVYSYAQQLLATNISQSQVAVADFALMNGFTDPSTAHLAAISTQFLPGQVQFAVAQNFAGGPTVYAAQVYALALAEDNGGNNAFATAYLPLVNQGVAVFAAAVSTLTGTNESAIITFYNNWIAFYSANPNAAPGVSAQLAATASAFGDALGVALVASNPTALNIQAQVQNALIDNAEGSYTGGTSLIAEPPHLPLQGEALQIPNAGGGPFGPMIDFANFAPFTYAQFVAPAQTALLEIQDAPDVFTLNVQHFGVQGVAVEAAGSKGKLLTFILGDSTANDHINELDVFGYSIVHIVVANGSATNSIANLNEPLIMMNLTDFVISGKGFLTLNSVFNADTITDNGVALATGSVHANEIDASEAPLLLMTSPVFQQGITTIPGVTIFGGTGPGNLLQGSLNLIAGTPTITFSNGTTGVSVAVGPDKITAGSGGGDFVLGEGGSDTITLPNPHLVHDTIVFGQLQANTNFTLAITDGNDVAYRGYWGASATAAPIPALFPGNTGGTSTDMTVISGFRAGPVGDVLEFNVAAWNGASTGFFAVPKGDLVSLGSAFVVQPGAAQLSAVWVNIGSNPSLQAADNVLLYAPAGVAVQSAQQLVGLLHSAADAVTLPGSILPGQDKHVLVAYQAEQTLSIADVDLVNIGVSNQSSTANLNVYASDMVSLPGVPLASLTSANIHFV